MRLILFASFLLLSMPGKAQIFYGGSDFSPTGIDSMDYPAGLLYYIGHTYGECRSMGGIEISKTAIKIWMAIPSEAQAWRAIDMPLYMVNFKSPNSAYVPLVYAFAKKNRIKIISKH